MKRPELEQNLLWEITQSSVCETKVRIEEAKRPERGHHCVGPDAMVGSLNFKFGGFCIGE